jgi:hypothetical protein
MDLAARTEGAIEHLNANRNYLCADVYVDPLEAISRHADRMKELVDLHLDLAGTEDRLERLRQISIRFVFSIRDRGFTLAIGQCHERESLAGQDKTNLGGALNALDCPRMRCARSQSTSLRS